MQLLPYAILDMDGTLLDSTGMWDVVADRVLARWGKTFPREDRRDNMTLTIEGSAEFYVNKYQLPITPEEAAKIIREEARRAYAEVAVLKPGALDALDLLGQWGVRMCVASGTEKALVDAALTRFGILDRFAFTIACTNPQGKAEPEVYLRATELLGAPGPEQVMVFEDSPTAVHTAKKAGFFTIAVRDTFTEEDWPATRAVADAAVESWPQWVAEMRHA